MNSAVIGIRCTDGVVLGVEKLIRNKMLVTKSYRRIFTTSMNSGLAIGGLLPDGRQLVNRCRDESSSYKTNFGIPIPGTFTVNIHWIILRNIHRDALHNILALSVLEIILHTVFSSLKYRESVIAEIGNVRSRVH